MKKEKDKNSEAKALNGLAFASNFLLFTFYF